MPARKAILAGSWYPATAAECRREIEGFIKTQPLIKEADRYLGGIVPHAGWYFSGSIAANVIRHLAAETPPDVIILFGMHLHPGSSNYLMKEGTWETPLGDIEIASELALRLEERFPFMIETPDRFVQDNTVEVQLPFIKYFLNQARIVPIGVPPTPASFDIGIAAAEISKSLRLKVKIIGSTDLTHYGENYGFSPGGAGSGALDWTHKNDANLIHQITSMNPNGILSEAREHQNACCSGAAATAVTAVKALGAQTTHLVSYATSYDKSPGDSFVGYAGVLFS